MEFHSLECKMNAKSPTPSDREILPSSLKKYAHTNRVEMCKHDLLDRIKQIFSDAYYPTPSVTVVIISLMLVVFVVGPEILTWLFPEFCSKLPRRSLSRADAIALHAGVGTTIFALMLFVAEGLRDSGNKDRGRVYLKESQLYPLIVTSLTVFVLLIVSNRTFANTFAVCFVLLLTLISIYRLLRVCLSNGLFQKRRSQLLRDLVYKHVDRSVERRIAINHYLSILNSDTFPLQYRWFHGISEEKFHRFVIPKNGYVEDIDLSKLKQVAELIDEYGALEGKAYFSPAGGTVDADEVDADSEILPPELQPPEQDDHRYIHVKPGDEIEPTLVVLSVSKAVLTQQSAVSKIQNLLESAFAVAEREPLDFDLRLEFESTKRELLRMLKAYDAEAFKDSFNVYLELIEEFSARIEKCSGKYEYAQAIRENGSFYTEGWEELNWIRDDLRLFMDQGFLIFENERIREAILMIPNKVTSIGLKKADHLIFQQGINLFAYALNMLMNEKKNFSEIFRSYANLFKYYLRKITRPGQIDDKHAADDVGFYSYSILSLAGLIKNLILKNMIDEASSALDVFEKSFENYRTEIFYTDWSAILSDVNSQQFRTIQFRSAFAAWLAKKELSSDGTASAFENLRQRFLNRLPDDFCSLLQMSLQMIRDEVEMFWGWDHWDTRPDGQAYWIERSMIARYFGVPRLVEKINQSDTFNAESISAFLSSQSHPLEFQQILAEISSKLEIFKILYPAITQEKLDLFNEFLKNVISAREDREAKKLRTTITSENIKASFIQNFHTSYRKQLTVRPLLMKFGKVVDRANEAGNTKGRRYGINRVDEKGAFIEGLSTTYLGWWENYSAGMAQGEDEFLVEKFRSVASVVQIGIDDLSEAIVAINARPSSVVFFHEQLFTKLYKLPYFKPVHMVDHGVWPSKHISGILTIGGTDVPLFSIRGGIKDQELLVVELEKAPALIQLPPLLDSDQVPMKQYKHFGYLLEAYSENEEVRLELLRDPPDWLLAKGNVNQINEYLDEKVLVRIYENVDFEELQESTFAQLIQFQQKQQLVSQIGNDNVAHK